VITRICGVIHSEVSQKYKENIRWDMGCDNDKKTKMNGAKDGGSKQLKTWEKTNAGTFTSPGMTSTGGLQ